MEIAIMVIIIIPASWIVIHRAVRAIGNIIDARENRIATLERKIDEANAHFQKAIDELMAEVKQITK